MSNNPEIDAAIKVLAEAGYTVTPPRFPKIGLAPNALGTNPLPPRPITAGMPTDARARSTKTHDL